MKTKKTYVNDAADINFKSIRKTDSLQNDDGLKKIIKDQ